jgi:hypothetical protein
MREGRLFVVTTDEEEDVSSFWMTLGKREDTGNCGELVLEEAVGPSYNILQDE